MYNSIHDLMTDPQYVRRETEGNPDSDADKELVEACVRNSLSRYDEYLNRRGFVQDAKLDTGWGVHTALHLAFDTCDPEMIGIQLAIMGIGENRRLLIDALKMIFDLGFTFGAAFQMEDAERAAREPKIEIHVSGTDEPIPPEEP